jgi:hypothetical protein
VSYIALGQAPVDTSDETPHGTQNVTARFQPSNREWFGCDENFGDDDEVLDDSDGDASVTSNSSDSAPAATQAHS